MAVDGWTLERRNKEGDYLFKHPDKPLVFVAPQTAKGQTLGSIVMFVLALGAKLGKMRHPQERRLETLLKKLETWLMLDDSSTTQLFITRTQSGYEVGFARFGALSQKTSKGSSLVEALERASYDVVEAIDFDATPPPYDVEGD